jgi:hypothetical protein
MSLTTGTGFSPRVRDTMDGKATGRHWRCLLLQNNETAVSTLLEGL